MLRPTMLMQTRRLLVSLAFALVSIVVPVQAYNTAGSMLVPDPLKFNHPGLIWISWTSEILEYDHVFDTFRYRIEFNYVLFMGSDGSCSVRAMIQNVGHEFVNDIVGSRFTDPPSIVEFPAVGVYFSSLSFDWPEEKHGVELLLNPDDPPRFGRVFEDVDALGAIGRNIYTRNPLQEPPLTITWTATRREVVIDPPGNLAKNASGEWVPLRGTFAIWRFSVDMDGHGVAVADYYLPIEYAEYIQAWYPLVLHQEYFGAAEGILDTQKCTVRYTDMWVRTDTTSYPLEEWTIIWRADDEAGNLDNRFGWSSDGTALISRVGHESDTTECFRDPGHTFSIEMVPPTSAVFRVDSAGEVFTDGTLHANAFSSDHADLAEWVAVSEVVEPGDVLELDPFASQSYRRSTAACSSLVAGVVSTTPGIVLGGGLEDGNRALLALAGIVPVKVTDEGGPIQPGDLLVTSSTPGHAMRWSGPDPCPCALVGKALEPMKDESGVIVVLLTAH